MGFLFTCSLTLLILPSTPVQAAKSPYSILYEYDESDPLFEENVIKLWGADTDTYEVVPGDTLWSIADRLLGEGTRYLELAASNSDIISDPDLIYPGMQLQLNQTYYIPKGRSGSYSEREYSMNFPQGWTVGILSQDDLWANFTLFGDGICDIACLIQDKESSTVDTTQNWEACVHRIQEYVNDEQEDWNGYVSDLQFEHYRTELSEDLYLYSYVYHVDVTRLGSDEPMDINVCVGLKLTEHIQAQFVGFAYDYDIRSTVRYVTASFRESEDVPAQDFNVNSSGMQISPAYSWQEDGLFNAFPWVDGYFKNIIDAITGETGEDLSPREKLLDQMGLIH